MPRPTGRLLGLLTLVLAAVVALVGVAVLGGGQRGADDDARDHGAASAGPSPTPSPSQAPRTPGAGRPPNVVMILMDDFSTELLRTMPHAQQMVADGAVYPNAFVVDSLCCPSRASTLTGQAPHHTGVLTNTPNDLDDPIGGWDAFERGRNLERSFPLALQSAGYTTGFVGKLLNRYEVRPEDGGTYVPDPMPGWTEFEPVFGGGYNGWGYKSGSLDGEGGLAITDHDVPPTSASTREKDREYAGSLIQRTSLGFLRRHADDDAPYFLEIAPYAPHARISAAYPDDYLFPPAFRDRPAAGESRDDGGNCGAVACTDLTLDDLVGYDDPRGDNAPTYLREDGSTERAPAWRTNAITLTDADALREYRDRARMVQSIDRTIGEVRRLVGPDTYVVLTADNGYHLGQHQLNGGKGTPYDSDARVPLVVVGPDVEPGERTQLVSNLDLAPTFEELAGTEPAAYRDGTSFADSLSDPQAPGGRFVYYDHTFAPSVPGDGDPDVVPGSGGTIDIIPSFVAVRSERGLLVRLDLDDSWEGVDHAWELYTYKQGFEKTNSFAKHHRKPWVRDLRERLEQWGDGDDGRGCRPAQCRALAR